MIDMTAAHIEWVRMEREYVAGERADLVAALRVEEPRRPLQAINRLREFDVANDLPRLTLLQYAYELNPELGSARRA